MINARRKDTRPTPLWATLGAPLLGIPLLVALLSLVAPEPDMDRDAHWSASDDAAVGLAEPAGAPEVTVDATLEAVFVTGADVEECEGPADETETKES